MDQMDSDTGRAPLAAAPIRPSAPARRACPGGQKEGAAPPHEVPPPVRVEMVYRAGGLPAVAAPALRCGPARLQTGDGDAER
jgi:hypothetical protein